MGIDRGRRQSNSLSLRDAIDQLVAGSVITSGATGGFPPADMYLTDEEVVLELAIPGANADDINISVTGDVASLSGEIGHSHPQGHTYVSEIPSGRFERSFALPIEVDAGRAEASYENGILELRLPKSEATKPRKIQVRPSRG